MIPTPDQVKAVAGAMRVLSQARDTYRWHDSVTPWDIQGHTVDRSCTSLTYKREKVDVDV